MFLAARNLLRAIGLLTVAMVVALLGCGGGQTGEDLPKTYEVRGTVLKASGEAMAGGSIEFAPKQPGGQKFYGQIQPDGSFKATTIAATGTAGGAPEGVYTAVVLPPISNDAQQQHTSRPIKIVEEYTVAPTGENNFTVRLPATGP